MTLYTSLEMKKQLFFFIGSLSNAPLINSSRGGIQLEVLAVAIALRSSEKKNHQKKRAAVQTRSDKFATLSAGRSQTSHFLWRAGVLVGPLCGYEARRGMILSHQYYFSVIWMLMPPAVTDRSLNSTKH